MMRRAGLKLRCCSSVRASVLTRRATAPRRHFRYSYSTQQRHTLVLLEGFFAHCREAIETAPTSHRTRSVQTYPLAFHRPMALSRHGRGLQTHLLYGDPFLSGVYDFRGMLLSPEGRRLSEHAPDLGRSISGVNRWRLIDLSFALDVVRAHERHKRYDGNGRGHRSQATDPGARAPECECNMARFYVVAIEPTLFGEMALVREWGRIGSSGRRRLDLHPNRAAAAEKARRGYRVRVSHFLS